MHVFVERASSFEKTTEKVNHRARQTTQLLSQAEIEEKNLELQINIFHNQTWYIWDWLWHSWEISHCGGGLISIFQGIFARIDRIFVLAWGLCIGVLFSGV